jgi:hypothetical protein
MKKLMMSAVAVTAIIGSVNTVSANDGVNILNDIKVKGEIRPRFETASDNGSAGERAQSLTARTHLSITGGLLDVKNLTATVGLQSVNNFGYTNYNSTQNGNTKYDKIVDPQAAMLSEASIDYKMGKTAMHAGRSQLNLDNQRFIGTVGWRQLERSYDTAYVADNSIENLNLLAAYVYGYAGVKSVPTTDTNSILLHAVYKLNDALKVTAYDYMLADTHDTYGLALTGKIDTGMAKLNYRAEYAIQSDATMELGTQTSETGKADADYINLDLGANISGVLAGVNYEALSGTDGTDGKTAFSTPLATGHKFNGWADKFLTTPTGGLIDANIRIGYKAKGLGKILAVYHNFTADKKMGGNDDLGSELDVVYVNKVPGVNNLTALLKGAAYTGGNVTGYTETKKVVWAQLDYKFAIK